MGQNHHHQNYIRTHQGNMQHWCLSQNFANNSFCFLLIDAKNALHTKGTLKSVSLLLCLKSLCCNRTYHSVFLELIYRVDEALIISVNQLPL